VLEFLQLLTAVAVLAVAVGGLAWTVGRTHFGARAVVLGVVLFVVRNALLHQGAALIAVVRPHLATAATVVVVLVVTIALGRILMTRGAKPEPKLSGKRRVARGP